MGKRIEVKTGDRYGLLTVIESVESTIGCLRKFKCRCVCGSITTAVLKRLRNGTKRSCGCLHKETAAENGRSNPQTIHGKTRTPIYNTWRGMVGRCSNPLDIYYHNYGGRGITVCKEWHNASTFIAWALTNGWKEGLQIDRIDNDGNYEPSNCRFVSRTENCRNARSNRLLTFRGVTKPIAAWAEELPVTEGTIRSRIRRGWTPEQALTFRPQRGKKP